MWIGRGEKARHCVMFYYCYESLERDISNFFNSVMACTAPTVPYKNSAALSWTNSTIHQSTLCLFFFFIIAYSSLVSLHPLFPHQLYLFFTLLFKMKLIISIFWSEFPNNGKLGIL